MKLMVIQSRKLLLLALVVLVLAPHVAKAQSRLAIVGGTLIDVSNFGRSTNDKAGQTILIEDGRITAVGPSTEITVPSGFFKINALGKFITPGLVDGFAVLNNQAYAQAYLAMGVTTIVGVSGGRRGPLFRDADPGPTIYRLEDVGFEEKTEDELLERLEAIAKDDVKVALLMYSLTPEKLRLLTRRAKDLGLATIGELAQSRYVDGMNYGVDAFVHTTRYSLGMANDEMIAGIAQEPFSNELHSPKWKYYRWLSSLDAEDPKIVSYSKRLAKSDSFLIPTAGLLYLHRPHARNPWTYPAASLIDPKDVNRPASKTTGIPNWTLDQLEAYRALARATEHIEKSNRDAGCKYLAGSGTDVWGTMPGISLHTELASLVRWGMTPREALACATSNYAKAYRWHELGQVKAGSRGDILILDADPRLSVTNLQAIHRVVARGAVLDPKALLVEPGRDNGKILLSETWQRHTRYLDKKYDFLKEVKIDNITYRSNTLDVTGVIAQPKKAGKYPCVIYLRGGNREFGQITDRKRVAIMGKIASWGYVVVGTNYRGVAGGTGIEEFGGAEVHDVLNLIPLLEGLPNADATRIGIRGGSRGGMMTYLTMKATDRIKAAVVRAGLSDLVRCRQERGEMETVFRDLIPNYDRLGDATLRARSVVDWPEKLKSKGPLLILHGTADWRVLPGSGLSLAESFQKVKHPYRLMMLAGSDHSLSEHRKEVADLTRMWLDRYVKNGAKSPDLKLHGN